MTEKAKAASPPPKVEPKVVEAPPVAIPDGANEAGAQPPSHVGTCLDCNRGVVPEEGE